MPAGKVDFANLWRDFAQQDRPASAWPEALESERRFAHHMLTPAERKHLAALAPETAWVMGVSASTKGTKRNRKL